MGLPFFILDVFAERKYAGNQLAVVIDKDGLPESTMQDIAREMHFSETAFVRPEAQADGSFAARIFTPEHEVPFAGHPTLGTAFAIREEIIRKPVREVVLDLATGHIPVTFTGEGGASGILWMRQNSPAFTKDFDRATVAEVLSIPVDAIDPGFPVQEVSTGLPFILVPLASRNAVTMAKINRTAYDTLISTTAAKAVLVFCREPVHTENTLHARMFGDYYGVPEDPATGSATGCLAGYLLRNGYFSDMPPVVRVEQGYAVNRPSLLYCKAAKSGDLIDVDVGGNVIMVARGELL